VRAAGRLSLQSLQRTWKMGSKQFKPRAIQDVSIWQF